MEALDVAIAGGGPAGLAAAQRLARLGIRRVAVFERESEIGGIPRHCGHTGFGWQSHRRLWSGPRFATALREEVQGLDIRTGTTVLEIMAGGRMLIRDASGTRETVARRVLIATGTRETPRAARLIGGSRPQGVMNTGALQQHVYLHGHRPFMRPAIIGMEWVSYSAILTCRHLGIKPAAMIAESDDLSIPAPAALAAKLLFAIPVFRGVAAIEINGRDVVDSVSFDIDGARQTIGCDGVIVSGRFRPENRLVAKGPHFFTAGNVNAPLKSSGRCWLEGCRAAETIAGSLA